MTPFVGTHIKKPFYNLCAYQKSGVPMFEEPSQSNRQTKSQAPLKIAESQNGRVVVAESTRKRKGKTMVKRDLNVEKANEVKELVETRAQFQHMMTYFCANLGIPQPPLRGSGDQAENHPKPGPTMVELPQPTQSGRGEPSQCSRRPALTRLQNPTQEPPRSHQSDKRLTISNTAEAP